MFSISRADWRRIAADPEMIEPIDPKYTDGVTKWSASGFVRWLAVHHPELAQQTPHLLRPAGEVAPQYHGGSYTTSQLSGLRHEHFVGHWRTGYGGLAIIYPRHHAFPPAEALEHFTGADTVIVVQHDWNLYGLPDLEAVDRARPDLVYEPHWSDVSAHIGALAPWWPSELRRKEHLTAWRPAHQPQAVQVVTWPDWEPLYDMALSEAKKTPVRIACFSIGHELRARAVEHVDWEIAQMTETEDSKDAREYVKRQAAERACMVIPAFPDSSDPGQAETGNEEVIREGVAQLWQRTDDLAVECLEIISMWTSQYMPFAGSFSVTTKEATAAGREWIQRLKKTEPTAIHRVWDTRRDGTTEAFTDPVTRSPVIAKNSYRPTSEVTFESYAPRRLPAGSQIQEIILDNPIWARTQDGTLYPAPVMDAPGVSWGYSGSGPGALATLIGRLLDDGSAHALTYRDPNVLSAEPKLEAFLQLKHQRGIRLPRRLLETVRQNGPDKLGLLDRLRYGRPRSS